MRDVVVATMCALLALAGCGGDGGGANDGGGIGDPTAKVAEVEYQGSEPALFVQSGNGAGRRRIHFDGAANPIAGNGADLEVRDDTILAMGPLRWSPDGRRLAVVVTLAFDQSEIMIVDEDGGNATVASVDTQIILSRPDWSADGSKLVYAMSTLPAATGVDAFVTDLAANTVNRLTEGAELGGPGGELRFASDGQAVLWSKATPTSDGPLDVPVSAIRQLALGTGVVTDVAGGIPGEIQGIARSGNTAVVARDVELDAGGRIVRSLATLTLAADGTVAKSVELAKGVVQYAVLLEGDARVLVVIDVSTDPATPKIAYVTVPAAGGPGQLLGALGNAVVAADVYRR